MSDESGPQRSALGQFETLSPRILYPQSRHWMTPHPVTTFSSPCLKYLKIEDFNVGNGAIASLGHSLEVTDCKQLARHHQAHHLWMIFAKIGECAPISYDHLPRLSFLQRMRRP